AEISLVREAAGRSETRAVLKSQAASGRVRGQAGQDRRVSVVYQPRARAVDEYARRVGRDAHSDKLQDAVAGGLPVASSRGAGGEVADAANGDGSAAVGRERALVKNLPGPKTADQGKGGVDIDSRADSEGACVAYANNGSEIRIRLGE